MLIIKGNIYLYDMLVRAKTLMSGVRCTLVIDSNPHICQIKTFDGNDIPLNTNIGVNILIISGEINLLSFIKGAEFTLFKGKEIGRGNVEEIKEVYLEKENLEVVKEKEVLRNIFDYAEQLSCALIYEDVYRLIE
ncbi:hypothetical protein IMSAGC005_03023 [Lachnospiraceae bacterium]|nr:hypothetical protein IMSAGC005_03023 [Lachnospiraceae bacterium]